MVHVHLNFALFQSTTKKLYRLSDQNHCLIGIGLLYLLLAIDGWCQRLVTCTPILWEQPALNSWLAEWDSGLPLINVFEYSRDYKYSCSLLSKDSCLILWTDPSCCLYRIIPFSISIETILLSSFNDLILFLRYTLWCVLLLKTQFGPSSHLGGGKQPWFSRLTLLGI